MVYHNSRQRRGVRQSLPLSELFDRYQSGAEHSSTRQLNK